MFRVDVRHFKPNRGRNGDLEEKDELVLYKLMKTRKEAKTWILGEVKRLESVYGKDKVTIRQSWKRSPYTSYVYVFTGETWVNENTGEKRDVFYRYILNNAENCE